MKEIHQTTYMPFFRPLYILFSINFCYKNVQREPKLILSCITEAVIVGWDCRRDESGADGRRAPKQAVR